MKEIIRKKASSIPIIIAYILQAQGIKTSRNEEDSHNKIVPSSLSKSKRSINCARAACNDISNNFHASMMSITKSEASGMDKKTSKGPIDRNELGHSTWNLLHTICANYPSQPNTEEQSQAEKLVLSIARLYPCPHCAKDFRAAVKLHPPRVESRQSFSIWCCERHNEVNVKLNKPVFPCTMEALDSRWGEEPEREEEEEEEDDNESYTGTTKPSAETTSD